MTDPRRLAAGITRVLQAASRHVVACDPRGADHPSRPLWTPTPSPRHGSLRAHFRPCCCMGCPRLSPGGDLPPEGGKVWSCSAPWLLPRPPTGLPGPATPQPRHPHFAELGGTHVPDTTARPP